MMAYEGSESDYDNSGEFINQLQTKIKTPEMILKILIKCVIIILLKMLKWKTAAHLQARTHTHTHTYTHTHIYIYIG